MGEKIYIDRDMLLNESSSICVNGSRYRVVFYDDIMSIPTTDVVEVVRCCDCKFRKTEDCAMHYECECGAQNSWENKNDFCSWGKRRNDND